MTSKRWVMRTRVLGVVVALCMTVAMTACENTDDAGGSAPTVAPEFVLSGTKRAARATPLPTTDHFTKAATPTASDMTVESPAETPTLPPTPDAGATAMAAANDLAKSKITPVAQPVIYEVPIYGGGNGKLSPGWSVTQSWKLDYNLEAPGRSISGSKALSMIATDDYGSLFFVNLPNSGHEYSRTHIVGLRMFLNAGEGTITPGNLAFTILGSNVFTYYVRGDNSVPTTTQMYFTESRLDELGQMRPLPPNTWVELDIDLNQLLYDPDYKYLTSFYIKTDIGFRQKVYIDNISLIMIK